MYENSVQSYEKSIDVEIKVQLFLNTSGVDF